MWKFGAVAQGWEVVDWRVVFLKGPAAPTDNIVTETLLSRLLKFFVPRVMTLPLESYYMRTEIWGSSTFWKLIVCSNATSGHR